MIRKLFLVLGLTVFFLSIPTVFHIYNYSQSMTVVEKQVVYDLPYPGILPDNPLYFLKAVRDKALDIGTRDPQKKAQLYLVLSDKRINAALSLAKKGKSQLAISTASKGEKYALKIPEILSEAKNQGSSPSSGFIERVKQSNAKHRQVLNEILKILPQGDQEDVKKALDLNDQVRKGLDKL